ncbi:hypothetical protein HCC30_17600 [Streptomyces sp. HNM0574]|nr:hypothetical protein [Streptomyces sp. HNM0574]
MPAPAFPAAPVPPATGTSAAEASGADGATAERPRADCTADSAGGLTFDVRLPYGDPARQDAALLLRRRGAAEGASGTVRLPLAPVGPQGPLRAALPSIMTLPEGRWDAYLVTDGPDGSGESEPQRLLPGLHDLRSLVDRTPRSGRTWLGVRIPYATRYGNLTVRAWLRWPHAEAGELRVTDSGLTLRGRLYGAGLGPSARLEAWARGAAEQPPVVVAAPADDGGRGTPGGDGSAGAAFAAELPYAGLVGHEVWDLWLRPDETAAPVRIARILDDVADKKRIFTYPQLNVPGDSGQAGEGCSVRPYYTLDNDLSLRVRRTESEGSREGTAERP